EGASRRAAPRGPRGGWGGGPRHEAGWPERVARRKMRPSRSDEGPAGALPTFATPLCPAPMPSTLRLPETTSTDAAADAVTEGCRVTRLVTHVASRMREVAEAAMVMATHGSMALPGVSAMPTMSKPCSSPRRAMRSVYSGVYGQKKNPTRMRLRSGLGGRIVARVGGTLEELLGLVGPELRDRRVRMDHGVHELATGLLHSDDVDVLGGIAVLVELDGTTRVRHRLDGAADGRHELLPIFHLAVQRLRGIGDPASRAVHDGGEVGGRPSYLGRGELHEDLVGGVLQGRAPEQRAHDAHGLIAHAAERALVRHHAGANEGRLGLEPGFPVLLDEAHGLSALPRTPRTPRPRLCGLGRDGGGRGAGGGNPGASGRFPPRGPRTHAGPRRSPRVRRRCPWRWWSLAGT